jgi:hypothetical protein
MWTDASREADLVRETVPDIQAQMLLLQARVNVELFKHTAEQLQDELDALNFHDFARTQSCHMNEGIFGADKHAADMMVHKAKVVGFLLATVTAGHRFIRSVINARSKDRGRDWRGLRQDLGRLESEYHKVRNFLEHLDKAVASGSAGGLDCTFTPTAILTCSESTATFKFDFSKQSLGLVEETYHKVIAMLTQRKLAMTPGI